MEHANCTHTLVVVHRVIFASTLTLCPVHDVVAGTCSRHPPDVIRVWTLCPLRNVVAGTYRRCHPRPCVLLCRTACGNSYCEYGEEPTVCAADGSCSANPDACPSDCPLSRSQCPGASTNTTSAIVACGGHGRCLTASGSCSCFSGYVGDACDACAAGYLPLGTDTCVFPPGALSNCSDGVQNGNELGVDCGGRCVARLCPPSSAGAGGATGGNGWTPEVSVAVIATAAAVTSTCCCCFIVACCRRRRKKEKEEEEEEMEKEKQKEKGARQHGRTELRSGASRPLASSGVAPDGVSLTRAAPYTGAVPQLRVGTASGATANGRDAVGSNRAGDGTSKQPAPSTAEAPVGPEPRAAAAGDNQRRRQRADLMARSGPTDGAASPAVAAPAVPHAHLPSESLSASSSNRSRPKSDVTVGGMTVKAAAPPAQPTAASKAAAGASATGVPAASGGRARRGSETRWATLWDLGDPVVVPPEPVAVAAAAAVLASSRVRPQAASQAPPPAYAATSGSNVQVDSDSEAGIVDWTSPRHNKGGRKAGATPVADQGKRGRQTRQTRHEE